MGSELGPQSRARYAHITRARIPAMLTQHFLIDGAYLGSTPRYPLSNIGTSIEPCGYSFCCGTCGDQWAKAGYAHGVQWQFLIRPCRKCQPRFSLRPAGSVITGWDFEHDEALPDAVLRRELLLHLDWFERNSQ